MPLKETTSNEKSPTDRFFDLFWHLTNEDFNIRVKATLSLLKTLELSNKNSKKHAENSAFKGVNADINYTLDRLIKGLLAKRSSAREGFALALSEVCASIFNIKVFSTNDKFIGFEVVTKYSNG